MNIAVNVIYKKKFWLPWFICTVIGSAFSLLIMILFLGKLINNFPPLFFGLVIGALFGGCTGIMQSIILKKHLPHYKQWPIATTAGWMIFWSLNFAGYFGRGQDLESKIIEGVVHGLLFGLIIGLLQSFCFKQGNISVKWIIYNMLLWSASAAIADGLKMIVHSNAPLEFIIALPLSALFSGLVMQRILFNNFQTNQKGKSN